VLGSRGGRVLGASSAALIVLAAIVIVMVARHPGSATCGADAVTAPPEVLDSVAVMDQHPVANRDRLAAAVDAMGAPFGPVRAGIDDDYQQFLHLYGVPGGMLAWTKDNAPVSFLDSTTLKPRWSLRPTSARTAWDAGVNRFLLLDLSTTRPIDVAEFNLSTGSPRWCVQLAAKQRAGDPVGTAFLPGGDVVTALPDGDGIRLTRLAGSDGSTKWTWLSRTAGRADYLGTLSDRVLLVGGVEEYRLAIAPGGATGTATLTALDTTDGHPLWTWGTGTRAVAHIVGTVAGQAVIAVRTDSGTDLVGLGGDGRELWKTHVAGTADQTSLRGDVLLVRSNNSLDAYDARTGKESWHRPLPTDRTYFPYGFTLDQMPSTDAEHVLMPTTMSLEILDLGTGRSSSFALPTAGLSTEYWPYQLAVTSDLIAVLTNTGAVVAGRR
jgi:hypothetical protein